MRKVARRGGGGIGGRGGVETSSSLSDFVTFSDVIARSKATWQSILLNSRLDCFASLAMTKNKCVFRMNMVFVFCKSDRLPGKRVYRNVAWFGWFWRCRGAIYPDRRINHREALWTHQQAGQSLRAFTSSGGRTGISCFRAATGGRGSAMHRMRRGRRMSGITFPP